MPNLGPQYDLAARIAALEEQVRRMQANPLAQAFSMTQSDGSVGMELGQDPTTGSGRWIVYQGTTTTRDADTDQHPVFMYLGELQAGGVPVDSGVIFWRPDGSESLTVGAGGAGILDKAGDQVITTDETSGEGIADPWIPLPYPAALGATTWPQTNATSWGTVAENEFRAQQPKVWWAADGYADPGTNGQIRAVITNVSTGATAATGATWSVTGGAFTTISDTLALPAGFWAGICTFQVQCQVTSGTGSVYCQTLSLYGRQS